MRRGLLLLLAGLLILGTTARGGAQVSVGTTLFDKGKSRLSLVGGWGEAYSQSYFVLGAGAGYYLLPGLEAGVDWESWVGDSPQINKLTPGLRYVFLQAGGSFFPYIGGFYRRTFTEDHDDADSAGGRLGVYMPINPRTYFGVGGVVERQIPCDTNVYSHCSVFYPEFALTFAF